MKAVLLHYEIFDVSLTIGAYRFFGFLAAVLMIFKGYRILRKYGVQSHEIVVLSGAFALIFLLGARFLNVLLYFKKFIQDPLLVVEPALHNFTMYGGFFAVLIAGGILCHKKNLPLWEILDAMAPWAAGSAAILKIGCFFNGCCYGILTESTGWCEVSYGKSGLFLSALSWTDRFFFPQPFQFIRRSFMR